MFVFFSPPLPQQPTVHNFLGDFCCCRKEISNSKFPTVEREHIYIVQVSLAVVFLHAFCCLWTFAHPPFVIAFVFYSRKVEILFRLTQCLGCERGDDEGSKREREGAQRRSQCGEGGGRCGEGGERCGEGEGGQRRAFR